MRTWSIFQKFKKINLFILISRITTYMQNVFLVLKKNVKIYLDSRITSLTHRFIVHSTEVERLLIIRHSNGWKKHNNVL